VIVIDKKNAQKKSPTFILTLFLRDLSLAVFFWLSYFQNSQVRCRTGNFESLIDWL